MDSIVNLDKMDFHYWIDELPELEISHGHEKVIKVKAIHKALKDPLQVVLELSLHRHISSYRMLGFFYMPVKNTGSLTIRITYCEENSVNYLSQLKPRESCKYIYTGLELYFLAAVTDKIIDFSKNKFMPAGDLNFKIGANCEVASSPQFFGIITKILLNILITIEEKRLDHDYTEKLFTETILSSEIFIK